MNKFSTTNNLGTQTFVLALLLTSLPFAGRSQSQCILVCNDLITIKIPPGGTVEFTPDLMLEGSDPSMSCPDGVLSGQAYIGNTWQPASGGNNYVFSYTQVGQVIQARVRDSNSGNSCWGNVQILDENQQNDTVHFKLCSELWKDHRPVKGTLLKFQPHNSAFPYNPLLFALDSDHSCADVTVIPGDYLAGTTFEYGAELPMNDYLNGVNSIDLCMISEHILGISPLQSYPLFAADINLSNSVTTFDVIESRKLIQGIYTQFPNNSSWRAFPDYCTFPNPSNPFQTVCPAGIDLSQLEALNGDTARVICVKIGDVNGDVVLPGEIYVPLTPSDSVTLILPEATLVKNTPIKIPVKFDKNFDFTRLQLNFYLNSAVALFDSISDGTYHFNTGDVFFDAAANRLKVVSGAYIQSHVQAGNAVFYICLHPLQSADLQANLKLLNNDPSVKSFILGQHCTDNFKLGTEYSGMVATQTPEMNGVEIIPPSPNPFSGESAMQITLENAGDARLELFDAEGRLIVRETRHLPAGLSAWELPVNQIPGGSFVIWQLSVEGGRAQGKLFRRQN